MGIEGFDLILDTIVLAKELRDMGRDDIVQTHFTGSLSIDSYYGIMPDVISTVFSGFYSNYGDEYGDELMVITDDMICEYYCIAWEYGRLHSVSHDENPYVIDAEQAVSRWLGYCFSIGWKLLGYTKTKSAANKSKLVVIAGVCDSCGYDSLAYGLVQIHKFFSDKCAEYKARKGVMAA